MTGNVCHCLKVHFQVKERAFGMNMLVELVKQDMQKGFIKDWGVFPGEFTGYVTVVGNETEVMNFIQQYTPFVYFRVHPVGSLAQVEEMIKAMMN